VTCRFTGDASPGVICRWRRDSFTEDPALTGLDGAAVRSDTSKDMEILALASVLTTSVMGREPGV
jgi:hypothetical protein